MVVVGVLVAAWQVYEADRDSEIRQGAVVRGVDIGGLEPSEAVTALEPVVQEVAETVIELQFPDHPVYQDRLVELKASDLGISLDAKQTLAEADSPSPPIVRPAAWLFDLFANREVKPEVTTDLGTLAATVNLDPETPRIELVDGIFRPVLSTDVPVPDMELLARRLEEAVGSNPGGRVTVEVPVRGMEPIDPIAAEMATALAAHANEITAGGVWIQLEGTDEPQHFGELPLRQFIELEGEKHETRLILHPRIAGTLASFFVGIGDPSLPATLGLDETGAVTISEGEAGFKCCDASVVEALVAGMVAGEPVITLPAAPAPHPRGREWAESLGIVQVVGEFTTRFKPGQDRVTNIARIAELTRGVIIEPGGRFSVNEFVGPRTTAKGFVPAAMILDGVFVDSVGGGISQYATTVFNAAFFAGLDFIDYQSHSIYLSRYPYGREATVSYPAPDLVLENNTPHGMMLWPTTDAGSITVKLYSTPSVLAEQTGQTTQARGTSCTRVVTERTRTWLEGGRTETDTVFALYRPEGLLCDGTPSVTTTVPPEDGEDPDQQEGETGDQSQSETGDQSQGETGDEAEESNSELPDPPDSEPTSSDTDQPDSSDTPSTTIPDESQ